MKQPLFTLVYEDANIAAFNKSSGIAVCPDRWDDSKARLDRLAAEFLNIEKIYVVHRIDRDTSGLVIFAKNAETHKNLSGAFETGRIRKRYVAVVQGRPVWKETICDLPLVPDGNKQHHTIIDRYQGKKSLTRFCLLGNAGNYSVVEAIPETGRTHQIRVHLASLGHSIVCDAIYGNTKPVFLSSIKNSWRGDREEERPLLGRLGLHAMELTIPGYQNRDKPAETIISGNEEKNSLNLKAPLSRDMAALVKQMEKCIGSSFGIE